MSVSSFLIFYYINLGISLETAVFWLGFFLIFSQILVAVGGGVAIKMSWFARNYCPSPIVG